MQFEHYTTGETPQENGQRQRYPLCKKTFDQIMITLLTQLCEDQDRESMEVSDSMWNSPVNDISWNTQDGIRDAYEKNSH